MWYVLVIPIDDGGRRRPQNHYKRTRGFTCGQRCDRRIEQGFCELPGEPRRKSLRRWNAGIGKWGLGTRQKLVSTASSRAIYMLLQTGESAYSTEVKNGKIFLSIK